MAKTKLDVDNIYKLLMAAAALQGYPKLKPLLDQVHADLEALLPQEEQPEAAKTEAKNYGTGYSR